MDNASIAALAAGSVAVIGAVGSAIAKARKPDTYPALKRALDASVTAVSENTRAISALQATVATLDQRDATSSAANSDRLTALERREQERDGRILEIRGQQGELNGQLRGWINGTRDAKG